MSVPPSHPVTRKCQGCGYRFRAYSGETYCSSVCAGRDATAAVYWAVGRFAVEHRGRAEGSV